MTLVTHKFRSIFAARGVIVSVSGRLEGEGVSGGSVLRPMF